MEAKPLTRVDVKDVATEIPSFLQKEMIDDASQISGRHVGEW